MDLNTAKALLRTTAAMQAARKSPPNWGRSARRPAAGGTTELIRITLPRPDDLTCLLTGYVNAGFTDAEPGDYHVSIGNGGIAREVDYKPGVKGVCIHVVAQTLIVQARFASVLPAGTNQVARAMAGIGRPNIMTIVEQSVDVADGAPLAFLVPDFVRRVRVQAWEDGASPTAPDVPLTGVAAGVRERNVANTIITDRTAQQYADFVELEPDTWRVQLYSEAGSAKSWHAMITWELQM